MFKTALKVLIAASVSAVVVFSTDADAAGKRRGFVFSTSPVVAKVHPRRIAVRRATVHGTMHIARARVLRPRIVAKRIVGQRFVRPRIVGPRFAQPRVVGPRYGALRYIAPRIRIVGVQAQGADDKPSTEDLMAGLCNGAGGGASTGRDGKVHCIDPDGNEVLDPVPAPD